MKNQRPAHPWINADELARETETFDEPNGFRTRRQKAVGRSFDEPAVAAFRGHDAPHAAGRLDERHATACCIG